MLLSRLGLNWLGLSWLGVLRVLENWLSLLGLVKLGRESGTLLGIGVLECRRFLSVLEGTHLLGSLSFSLWLRKSDGSSFRFGTNLSSLVLLGALLELRSKLVFSLLLLSLILELTLLKLLISLPLLVFRVGLEVGFLLDQGLWVLLGHSKSSLLLLSLCLLKLLGTLLLVLPESVLVISHLARVFDSLSLLRLHRLLNLRLLRHARSQSCLSFLEGWNFGHILGLDHLGITMRLLDMSVANLRLCLFHFRLSSLRFFSGTSQVPVVLEILLFLLLRFFHLFVLLMFLFEIFLARNWLLFLLSAALLLMDTLLMVTASMCLVGVLILISMSVTTFSMTVVLGELSLRVSLVFIGGL